MRTIIRFLPIGVALLCVQLDFFSLNLALPTIAASIGLPVTDLQWLVSAYLLGIGAFIVPAARIGDIIGRKRTMFIGLALFAITSAICALSTELLPLVIARAVQGLGAALIMPNTLALVTNGTTPKERPKVVGAMIGLAGIGTAAGPVVGGVLAGTVGWPWVFWINVPMALIAILGGLRLAESRNDALKGSFAGLDWWGVATVVLGLALLSVGIDNVNAEGWGSLLSSGLMALGVVVLVVFAIIERRVARDPLIHPPLLHNRPLLALVAVGTLGNAARIVFIVMATFELQSIRGLEPAVTGLIFVSASVGIALSGPVGGWACSRWPAPRVLAVSAMAAGLSIALLALSTALPIYIGALLVCGLASGLTYSVAQIGVQSVVPPVQSGEATSFLYMPIIALAGLAVVIASGIVEGIGGGKPTVEGIDAVLFGSAAIVLVAGVLLLVAELRGLVRAPAGESLAAP